MSKFYILKIEMPVKSLIWELNSAVNIGRMSIAGLDFGAEETELRQDVWSYEYTSILVYT